MSKYWRILIMMIAVLALVIGACSDDDGDGPEPDADAAGDVDGGADMLPDMLPDAEPDVAPDVEPDVEPDVAPDVEPDVEPDVADGGDAADVAGPSVTLEFTIDDSANNTVGPEGGSFSWNDFGRSGGDRIPLVDDGSGVWTATDTAPIPDEDTTYNYGANVQSESGHDDWIWAYDSREVGAYTITADASDGDTITVTGLTIPAHGDWDVRLTLDATADAIVNSGGVFDPTFGVTVKLSRAGFFPAPTTDDGTAGDETSGDEIHTFVLSEQIAASDTADDGTPMEFTGLMAPTDTLEFIWVIGGQEYKADGVAIIDGVTAEIRDTTDAGNPWLPVTPAYMRNDRNSAVIATPAQIDVRLTVDPTAADTAAIDGGVDPLTNDPNFTSSWILVQEDTGSGTFVVVPMFDSGSNGDETEDDGIWTFQASYWVGSQWGGQGTDFRGSTLFAAGADPLGRDPVPADSESRFKVRFGDSGWYGSLDGVTVEYREPGGDWTDITGDIGTVGLGDYALVIPE